MVQSAYWFKIWLVSTRNHYADMGTRIRCLVGQGLDRNPITVKPMSKLRQAPVQQKKNTGYIQTMSRPGPQSVKPLQIFTEPGQRLDLKIQGLYRPCPTIWENLIFPPWTNCGRTFDPEKPPSGFTCWWFENIILLCGQMLDNFLTWTDCGQSLNFNLFAPKSRESDISLWTDIRQSMDMDWLWTKSGF